MSSLSTPEPFSNPFQFHGFSGATTAASLLTTAAALVVFFSYKCDSIELLQTGIILYYITIALSMVEAILLFCAFVRIYAGLKNAATKNAAFELRHCKLRRDVQGCCNSRCRAVSQ